MPDPVLAPTFSRLDEYAGGSCDHQGTSASPSSSFEGSLYLRPSCSRIRHSVSLACSSGVNFGSAPALRPGRRRHGRKLISCRRMMHSRQIAKSRAFLSWSGYRSNWGTMTLAKSPSLYTPHLTWGLLLREPPGLCLLQARSTPTPSRSLMALKPTPSSARRLMVKCGMNRLLCDLGEENAKHPSPSARPEKYQPNASSDMPAIECSSLMTVPSYGMVVGGVGGWQSANPCILPAANAEERMVG